MKPQIYIETTIPSYYYERRTDSFALAFRDATKQWWDNERDKFRIVTSVAVIDELSAGDYQSKDSGLIILKDVELLEINTDVIQIADVYVQQKVMPDNLFGDALHLALASYHKCDFLLTWNIKHIANANKFEHIRRVNVKLGLFIPTIITPLELLGGSYV